VHMRVSPGFCRPCATVGGGAAVGWAIQRGPAAQAGEDNSPGWRQGGTANSKPDKGAP